MKISYKIPSSLLTLDAINGKSEPGAERKKAFHRDAKIFLGSVRERLGIEADIKSNLGCTDVSGEVILNADHIFIHLAESFSGPGILVMFRSREDRRDFRGGMNHFTSMSDLAVDVKFNQWIGLVRRLIHSRKQKEIA